jgi:hypothetical protein
MQITYAELKEFIDGLTPEQLTLPAMIYAGDVDDAMPVFSVCFNSKEEMGESLEGIPTEQPFMLI